MLFKVFALLGLLDVAAASILRGRGATSKSPLKSISNVQATNSTSQAPWLFFDFGFFNGLDSLSYLNQGMRVVAVEADPSLVAAAWQNGYLQPFLHAGTLQVLNYAIAPDGQPASQTTFYMNKCSKEWNSFYSDVGCRSCTPPHLEDPTKASCDQKQIQSTPCGTVFQKFGIPVYMKADMEGAESGCYKALEAYPVAQRPKLISGEVDDPDLVGIFARLGYTSFKVVRQESGHSGGWGDMAKDCRLGGVWRSQASAAEEMRGILDKVNVRPATDPCPSLTVGNGVWYDVHASKMPPQA